MIELTQDHFNGKDLKQPFTGFVLFHADWCGACQKLKPLIEGLSKVLPIASVNCTDAQSVTGVMNICNIEYFPTIFFYKDGKNMGKYEGGRSENDFMDFAQRNFAPQKPVGPGPVKPKDNSLIYIIILALIIIGIFLFISYNKK